MTRFPQYERPEAVAKSIGWIAQVYRAEVNEMAREFGDAAVVWTGGPNYAIAGATPWGLALMFNRTISEAGLLGEFGDSGQGWGGILELDLDERVAPCMDYRTAVEHDDFSTCLQLLQDQLKDYSPEGARREP